MSNQLKLRTDNELLEWVECPTITSGNKNIDTLCVDFGPEWKLEGAKYYASFFIDDPSQTFDIPLTDNQCKIPNQMLAQPGEFFFGVWAEANGQKIKSSEIKSYYLLQGGGGTNNSAAPVITPEYWYERNEESWI